MYFLLCMILLLFNMVQSCPTVTFTRGIMNHIGEASLCKFKLNGGERTATYNEMKMFRFYGYVMMDCPDCSMGIISAFNGCDDCIWCSHNEGISMCKSLALPIIISLVTAIILVLIIITIGLKFKLWEKLDLCSANMAKTHKKNKIQRKQKFALKIKSYNQISLDEDTDDKMDLNNIVSKRLYPDINNQQMLESTNGNNKNLSNRALPTAPQPSIDENEYMSMYNKVKVSRPSRPPTPPPKPVTFNKMVAAAGLAAIISTGLTKACDVTSYVSSENKIYTDDTFKTLFTGIYHMTDKQILCLKHLNGAIDKIIITSTGAVETYTPIYKTSDYKIDVTNAVWRCYQAGYCGYNSCLRNSIYPDWEGEETKPGVITSYGCFQGNDYCGFCSYYAQCKWYKYVLSPKGGLYTVYKKIKEDWIIKLTHVASDGVINSYSFSSGMINIKTTGGTSITILTPNRAKFFHNNYLLESNEGSLWNVEANKLGDYSSSLIGDLQIGLFNDNEIAFQTNDVSCYSQDCQVFCKTAESGLKRGLTQYYNYTIKADKVGYDRIVTRQEYMSFGLMITTKENTDILSVPASCSFEVVMSYGCIACTKAAYVSIRAVDIKSMGLVDIRSNCSLDRTRLACQDSPQLIVIDNHQRECNILILSSNQSLHVSLDYIFEGTVHGVTGLVSTSSSLSGGQMALQFLSSDTFLKSLGGMMGTITMIGSGIVIAKSVFKYLTVREGIKNVKKIDEIV